MKIQNTFELYQEIEYVPIQYSTCRDFDHISRYRGLRQVIHNPNEKTRFVSLETCNPFTSNIEVKYYVVPSYLENRLDIIALNELGSANYGWIIAYFNNIEDGYTVREGQRLAIPHDISSLFNKGEILAPVSPLTLNLGQE